MFPLRADCRRSGGRSSVIDSRVYLEINEISDQPSNTSVLERKKGQLARIRWDAHAKTEHMKKLGA